MENSLPIISADEIEKCSEGECCLCGLCCSAFRILRVPSIQGDIDSEPMEKDVGQKCPQLVFDKGRYVCVLHNQKDDPRMDVCREWIGSDINYRTCEPKFQSLMAAVANWVAYPESIEVVHNLRNQIRKTEIPAGVHGRLQQILSRPMNKRVMLTSYLVILKSFPEDIFDYFHLHTFLPKRENEMKNALFDIGLLPHENLFQAVMDYWHKTKSAQNV